jgi:hypothetical protein
VVWEAASAIKPDPYMTMYGLADIAGD